MGCVTAVEGVSASFIIVTRGIGSGDTNGATATSLLAPALRRTPVDRTPRDVGGPLSRAPVSVTALAGGTLSGATGAGVTPYGIVCRFEVIGFRGR
jgi:hypothetical protein